MNKIPALVAVLALACGSAMAQSGARAADPDRPAATRKATAAPGEGVGAKTKRAAKRVSEKTRNAMRRVGNSTRNAANRTGDAVRGSDSRRMGAATGSSSAEDARQARMDNAYDNWKNRQPRR